MKKIKSIMFIFVLLLNFGMIFAENLKIIERDVTGDKYKDVVLENRYLKLTFEPARGGRCSSVIYKPANKEMTSGSAATGGLFTDMTWPGKYPGDYARSIYNYRTKKTKKNISIELWGKGKTGFLSFVEIRKTITLTFGCPLIKVKYRLTNTPSSMSEFSIGLRLHNFLCVEKADKFFFTPTSKGVTKNVCLKSGKVRQFWQEDVVSGWSAYVSEDKTGMGFIIDYPYFSNFYQYCSPGAVTFEWWYNALSLKAGEKFETSFQIVPFRNLKRVDKVFAWGVVALARNQYRIDKNEQTVSIYGLKKQNIHFNWRLLRGSRRVLVKKGEGAVGLKTDTISKIRLPLQFPGNDQYVLQIAFAKGRKQIGKLQQVVNINTLEKIKIQPVAKKIGQCYSHKKRIMQTKKKEYRLQETVATPHFKWAKPYVMGKIKVLILTDAFNQREILELAQRFELQWDTVRFLDYANNTKLYKYSPGDRSIYSREAALSRLEKKLNEKQYDLIMIAGLRKRVFDNQAIKQIKEKVADGAGLILIDIDKMHPALLKIAKVAKVRKAWSGDWVGNGNDYIVNGLDCWKLFPRNAYRMTYQTDGKVVAKAGGDRKVNLISTTTYHKGRVAIFAYKTRFHLSAGITPHLNSRKIYKKGYPKKDYPYGMREIKYPTYRYWDYYFV